jgi:hypothetical protein
MRSIANTQPQTDQGAVASNGLSLNGNYDVTSAQVQAAIGEAPAGRRGHTVGQPGAPGRAVRARDQHPRLPVREGAAIRQDANQRRVGLYNMFNSNTGASFNQGYGTDGALYLRPLTILNPRFLRFNVTFDF